LSLQIMPEPILPLKAKLTASAWAQDFTVSEKNPTSAHNLNSKAPV
jgi:hypothetical protein